MDAGPVAGNGTERHGQVGPGPDGTEPPHGHPLTLHVGLNQPDRVEGGEPQGRVQQDGGAQPPVLQKGVAGRANGFRQVAGWRGKLPSRLHQGAGQKQRQQPHPHLQDKGREGRRRVEDPSEDRPEGLPGLAEPAHAPLVARVGVLLPFPLEGFVEKRTVGAADEGEGYPEKNLGNQHVGEGAGDGVDPPPRWVLHHHHDDGEDALQQEDLGEGKADLILPEEGDDRHGEEGHLKEGEGVELANVGGQ